MNPLPKIASCFKKLLFWIFSNLLWTIICFIIPFGVFIPNVMNKIKTRTVKFSKEDIFSILIFISIELFFGFSYSVIKKSINKSDTNVNGFADNGKDNKETEELIDKYSNLDYYFLEYNKHITVYKNGNGILTNSFTIIVNDINSVTSFKRELNVEDGQQSICFPSLKTMKATDLKYRFKNYCFRCKCTNNKDLIRSVTEEYWTDDSDNGDTASKNNTKDLKWIVRMNPSAIEIGKPYKISYVISIPGMFAIENGVFKETIANKAGTHGNYTSIFEIKHKVKKFTYTASFEENMQLFQKPIGKVTNGAWQHNLHYKNENNIIYDKYIFSADDLDIGSSISIEWCFKETNKKNGGATHENGTGEKRNQRRR